MSELVQIAPGVVFSSDVLGIAWARKYQPGSGNEARNGNMPSADRPGPPAQESEHDARATASGQLSLL